MGILRRALELLPSAVRQAGARARRDWSLSRGISAAARRGIVPPPRLWSLVGGETDFLAQGRFFFDYLLANTDVTPAAAVLDIGCGIGKHAVHFAEYLDPAGRYEGFDVEPVRIRWCRKALTSRFANLRFTFAPIKNAMYNPRAKASAAAFSFPYADESFDLVFLASVFTHMFDADVERYVDEIARVLKPGGACVATFYLLNDARRAAIAAGTTAFTFRIAHAGSWIDSPDPPETAVAHEETRIDAMLERAGLRRAQPIRYGVWDKSDVQDQDFVVAKK